MRSKRENRSRNEESNIGEKIQMALVWVIFVNAIVLLSFVLISSGILSGNLSDGNDADLSKLVPDVTAPYDVTYGSDSDPTDDINDSATQIQTETAVSERNTNEVACSNSGDDKNSTDSTDKGN